MGTLMKDLVQRPVAQLFLPIAYEKSMKSSLGGTERAFANFTIFSRATFRSPRSTPPTFAMESGAFGKLFLRVAPFVAKSSQRHAKSRLSGTGRHTSILEA
jgi:hypothetical protein